MYLFLLLKKVFSKLRLLMVTHIQEEKISITNLQTSAWPTLKRRPILISPKILVLLEDSEHNVKRQNVFSHLHIRHPLNARLLLKAKITILRFLVPSLKSYAWIFSVNVCLLQRTYSRMLVLVKCKFMKLSLLEDPLVSLRSNLCFLNSSMVRFSINQSTLMKQLLMVPLFKLPFSLDKVTRRLKNYFFQMQLLFLSVLKLLVV